MQLHLSDNYSSEDIYQAREEIFKLQNNLNQIEQLYHELCSNLGDQQSHVEEITQSVYQTSVNLQKGRDDLHQIVQSKQKKAKRRRVIIIFITATALLCFGIVINVLANVIRTFGFQRVIQPRQ